ncbi:response regulator [Desulfoprunum benzoelyticum]|uniref:Sensory/regulatory protein RpfC n=1 Tax=Desulfoprunum benzoelyticum TaxID=1506996 RepID=A0A840V822_9BACT|nr:response regulator [Desulfoprunum benzoelyticum]MBB5349131.1 signal transduction histidine kinase/DNA-binding response OmpR family regulator/HPt (histidine-containing phosphotransfer) domain-containing protein [Desulfoprunum benzoelyticum]MBM9530631.1 response regulator [Desulfoprunum benzoelyticum]
MLKPFFHSLPIKRKLTILILVITAMALLLFAGLSSINQIRLLRRSMLDNLTILAESVSNLSAPAVAAGSTAQVEKVLAGLQADPEIEMAIIYGATGEPLARFIPPGYAPTAMMPDALQEAGHDFIFSGGNVKLRFFHPIIHDGRRLGTVYILANTNRETDQIWDSALLLFSSLIVVLLVTQLISSSLQQLMTKPIYSLAKMARRISEEGDYTIRVSRKYNDEIGELIDDFNNMVEAVELREAELKEHRKNLELLVQERTEELRTKRDEALAAVRAKSEFLANMSHEIRTPMNGIIGVLSLLRDAPLAEEYRRLLDSATRSADSLLLIINDILDFTKIDAGRIDFESIVFDLRELMEETSELFIDAVNAKNLEFVCFVPLKINCRIKGDPTRLRQILTNMVSNAVKFTEQGEVVLRVEPAGRDGDRQTLRFSVQDTGIGIASTVIDRLFDKFTQADGSTTRKYGGTGLGLSVCKQLVEMQGGGIGVKSVLGQGSTFWFTLVFETAEDAVPFVPCAKITGRRILIVDDSASNRMLIEHYLQVCNVEMVSCGDAVTALAELETMRERGTAVDVALLDHHMPGDDGLTLAGLIRERHAERVTEMVLLSSGSVPRDKAVEAGIRSIVYKPIRQRQLYDILVSVISGRRYSLKRSEEKEKRELRLHGKVLLVDDEPINQKVAEAILQKFGLETEVAGNGWEAVRMVQAGDYALVLMDIQMPEMSGYEAAEVIRRREQEEGRERVVIIAMTANAMETTRRKCLAIGMDDFLTKPIKPDVLAERLLPWLGVPPDADAAGDGGAVEAPVYRPSCWNRNQALQFVGGDSQLLHDMMGLFLQRNTPLLLRVDAAIQARDARALCEAAHAYKGAVNHFAAVGVREIALALEKAGRNDNLDGIEELWELLVNEAASLQTELEQAYDAEEAGPGAK